MNSRWTLCRLASPSHARAGVLCSKITRRCQIDLPKTSRREKVSLWRLLARPSLVVSSSGNATSVVPRRSFDSTVADHPRPLVMQVPVFVVELCHSMYDGHEGGRIVASSVRVSDDVYFVLAPLDRTAVECCTVTPSISTSRTDTYPIRRNRRRDYCPPPSLASLALFC